MGQPMPVEIYQATAKDISSIRAIHSDLKRPLRPTYPASEYLLARKDGDVVGCAGTCLYEDGAYFYGLAVKRAWQRQGIGSQLMKARLEVAEAVQVDYAVALAMFWNTRFFRKHGFAPVKKPLLPASALFHSDLTDPVYRRSATMLRLLREKGPRG
jgi:N-acetylglutamate synthase-like GNAT family acetyltransferase